MNQGKSCPVAEVRFISNEQFVTPPFVSFDGLQTVMRSSRHFQSWGDAAHRPLQILLKGQGRAMALPPMDNRGTSRAHRFFERVAEERSSCGLPQAKHMVSRCGLGDED